MENFLQRIRKGIRYFTYFDYNGTPIKIRPLSSTEIDDAKMKSMGLVNPQLAGLMIKIRLNLHKKEKFDLSAVPDLLYKHYIQYLNEFDYWLVYYSLKDFMPEDFSIDDIRKMQYTHEIARDILSLTGVEDKQRFIGFIRSKDGDELAEILFKWHVPLASIVEDLTPLQIEFMHYKGDGKDKTLITMDELKELLPGMNKDEQ